MVDSCLERRNEAIKPCLIEFWVGLYELVLGFHLRGGEENGEEEKKKEKQSEKCERTGSFPFCIGAGPGRFRPDPAFQCS